MLCAKPVPVAGIPHPVPCGRCMNCRINKQRFWIGRLLCEASYYPESHFVTLTYDDDYMPVDDQDRGVLDPRDFNLWIKRFRKAAGSVRYFGVGEYGSKTWRPHFHAILFGQDSSTIEQLVKGSWKFGFTTVKEFTTFRARYIVGYTLKKMTRKGDPYLDGRPPEFARMSRKPPLGAAFALSMLKAYHNPGGSAYLAAGGELARDVRFEGVKYPLGKYWMEKIREELGAPKKKASLQDWLDAEENREQFLADVAKAAERAAKEERRAAQRASRRPLEKPGSVCARGASVPQEEAQAVCRRGSAAQAVDLAEVRRLRKAEEG